METWSSYIDGLGRTGDLRELGRTLRPGFELDLIREPVDMGRSAVSIHRHGVLLGYLPRPDARPVAKLMNQGGVARAFVLELEHERGLARRHLKSVKIEIELVPAKGTVIEDQDRPQGADADPAPRSSRRYLRALQWRVALAVAVGGIAVAAGAHILPEDTGAEQAGRSVLALAGLPSGPLTATKVQKAQERPAAGRAGAGPIGGAATMAALEEPASAPEPVVNIALAHNAFGPQATMTDAPSTGWTVVTRSNRMPVQRADVPLVPRPVLAQTIPVPAAAAAKPADAVEAPLPPSRPRVPLPPSRRR